MNEFIEQFLIEARELVEQGAGDLLALETQPDDRGRLDSAFRAFHTLKGAAGIVDFAAMARALHAAEDALDAVRAGSRPLTPRLVGDCLYALDWVEQWLDRMEAAGDVPADAEPDADAVVARFDAGLAASPAPPAPASGPDSAADGAAAGEAGAALSIGEQALEAQIRMLQAAGKEGLAGRLQSAARIAERALAALGRSRGAIAPALDRALAAADPAALIAALRAAPPPSPLPAAEPAVRALRVDVERVDALVRLTGELTVARTALGHLADIAETGDDPRRFAARLKDQHAVLERLVGDLQHAVLGMRVLPLRQAFQRFPRLVRELGAQLGKPVRLLTEGDDTEADKAVVEALSEPLLHVLRNAVDHGVEDAAGRRAAGKPSIGVITLRGRRDGDQVVIEIEDDGRGIDADAVRAAAARKGLASAAALKAMTDAEAVDLVFAPGFSTAAAVSDVSGRGVGMDAVRAAVERLGGRASLRTRPGQGTVVRLALPFTVMMTQVMVVTVGSQTFGVPFDAIAETVRVARDRIVAVGAARAIIVRGRTVPLIALDEALGLPPAGAGGDHATILIVTLSGHEVGLEVDGLGDRMDVMLKPIGGLLSGAPGLAGATLLGDGQVLLVLDLHALVA